MYITNAWVSQYPHKKWNMNILARIGTISQSNDNEEWWEDFDSNSSSGQPTDNMDI